MTYIPQFGSMDPLGHCDDPLSGSAAQGGSRAASARGQQRALVAQTGWFSKMTLAPAVAYPHPEGSRHASDGAPGRAAECTNSVFFNLYGVADFNKHV